MKKVKIFLITLFVLCLLSSFTNANADLSNPYYDLPVTPYLYDFSGGLKLNPLSTGIKPFDLRLTGSSYTPSMTTSSYKVPAFTPSFGRMASSTSFGSVYMDTNFSLNPYISSPVSVGLGGLGMTGLGMTGLGGFGVGGTAYLSPIGMGTFDKSSLGLSPYGGVEALTLPLTGLGSLGGVDGFGGVWGVGGFGGVPGMGVSSSTSTLPIIGSLPVSFLYSEPPKTTFTGSSPLPSADLSPFFGGGTGTLSAGTGTSGGGYGGSYGGYAAYGGGYGGGYGGYAAYGGGYGGGYAYSGGYEGGGSGGSSSAGGLSYTFYEGESETSVQSGTLTAGDIDDNLNFDSFLNYIDSILQSDSEEIYPTVTIADRVTIRITDPNGKGISNARVSIFPEGGTIPIIETFAGTNGIFYFFPTLDEAGSETIFTVQVRPPESETPSVNAVLDLNTISSDRIVDIVLDGAIQMLPDAMDLMIVMDATGSMSDELEYITTEFEDIVAIIHGKYPEVSMRFGLIVYRDIGDEYVVRDFEFTDSLNLMQQRLSEQHATGGGDYPEAVEQALAQAVSFEWSGGNTARLMFHVADAPPHNEFLKDAFEEARIAREMGIHIYSLSGSGVAEAAEFLMRSNACITQGRYLFLTDDSGVGNPHAEPSIPCYVVTRLDNLIVRVVDSELAGQRIEPDESEIIREVGTCVSGVCIEEQVEEQAEEQ